MTQFVSKNICLNLKNLQYVNDHLMVDRHLEFVFQSTGCKELTDPSLCMYNFGRVNVDDVDGVVVVVVVVHS